MDQIVLDRYQIIEVIGTGSFGTVVVAWDTRIQRKVAIKIIALSEVDVARAAFPGNAVPLYEVRGRHGSFVLPNSDNTIDTTQIYDAESGQHSPKKSAYRSVPLTADTEEGSRWLADVPGLDEARMAATLQDPNIVSVYDIEIYGRQAFLVMEYVEGITLAGLLYRYSSEMTLDTIAAVFLSVAHAIEVAHQNNVLHLDIKPDNILVNKEGQVKVTDFGLATLMDAQGHGSAGAGTIGYMPPEQMRRESLDVRTDEWALASITYEMLSGKNPFIVEGLEAAQEAIRKTKLLLPSVCWDDLDEEADDIVFCALCPDRTGRYESVEEFREDLQPFLGNPKTGKEDLAEFVQAELCADEEDEEDAGEQAGKSKGRRAANMAVRIAGALALAAIAVALLVNGQPIAAVAFAAAAVVWWLLLMKLRPF